MCVRVWGVCLCVYVCMCVRVRLCEHADVNLTDNPVIRKLRLPEHCPPAGVCVRVFMCMRVHVCMYDCHLAVAF